MLILNSGGFSLTVDTHNANCHSKANTVSSLHTVTLGRALELKHKPSVIYSLAVETANLFTVAGRYRIIDI